jgi:glycosyltransferase 2 family protein
MKGSNPSHPVATDAVHSVPSASSKRKILARLLASLLLLAVFIWVLRAGALPILPEREALSRANKLLLATYFVWFLIVQVSRGIRWSCLLKPFAPVPLKVAIDLTAIGNAALVLLPLRTGEFVRPLMARRYGVSGFAAASTIGAERIIDGFFVGLFLFTSLALAPGRPTDFELAGPAFRDPAVISRVARLALIGFSLAFLMLVLFRWQKRMMNRLIRSTLGRVSESLSNRLTSMLERLASGLEFLNDRSSAVAYLALTTVYWAMQIFGIWLLARACGFHELTYFEACAVTGVFALGFMLPAPPGFFGAFQATLYAGLLLYFSDARVKTDGAAAVFFAYVIQIGITLLVGAVSWWRERRYREKLAVTAL